MARLLLLLLLPGCIAAHGRAHVGPSVDAAGKVGLYAGVMIAGGYAAGPDSGVVAGGGAATGEESRLLLSGTIDYARLGPGFGLRAGVSHHHPARGERGLGGVHAALLYPLARRSSVSGPEHAPHGRAQSAWSIGVEALAGVAYHIIRGDDPHTDVEPGARLALTLEWLGFSAVR